MNIVQFCRLHKCNPEERKEMYIYLAFLRIRHILKHFVTGV